MGLTTTSIKLQENNSEPPLEMLSKHDELANNAYIDLVLDGGSGGGFHGTLLIANTRVSNANFRTQTVAAVCGRGTDFNYTVFSDLSPSSIEYNGTSGAASYTITSPSSGTVRVTNTSGNTTQMTLSYFGTRSM
jgi:hypothetical protein